MAATMNMRGDVGRWISLMGLILAMGTAPITAHAKPLGQATVTEINNDVRYQPANNIERPAKPKDVVRGADLLRTGQKSQAELQFEDKTITRLGSNSLFTFDPEKRDFDLRQGTLLFDMPKGNGGGRIRSAGITAAIEGTAGIVTSNHGKPKVICLTGIINVLDAQGHLLARLRPGQLFIVGVTPKPVDFLLKGIKTGKLWGSGLPNNTGDFEKSSSDQLALLRRGKLETTQFVLGAGDEVVVTVNNATSPFDSQILNPPLPSPDPLPPGPPIPNPVPPIIPQFTPAVQQQTALANLPLPFMISSDTEFRLGPGYAELYSLSTGQKVFTGTVLPATGQSVFDFGSMDLPIVGKPALTTTDPNRVVNMLVSTTESIAFTGMNTHGGSGTGPADFTSASMTFTGKNVAYSSTYFSLMSESSADPACQLKVLASDTLAITASTITLSSDPGYTYLGGSIDLQGTREVGILGTSGAYTTEITADGPTPGSIMIHSPGDTSGPGKVTLAAMDNSTHINLSAGTSAAVLTALPAGGFINISGNTAYDPTVSFPITPSITINADSATAAAAGTVSLMALQAINVNNARMTADGTSGAGGSVQIQAPSISMNQAWISASSTTGAAGTIQITGSTMVSIHNSILSTLGYMPGSGGITIRGATVDLTGTQLRTGPTGPANIYTNYLMTPPASGSYSLHPYP